MNNRLLGIHGWQTTVSIWCHCHPFLVHKIYDFSGMFKHWKHGQEMVQKWVQKTQTPVPWVKVNCGTRSHHLKGMQIALYCFYIKPLCFWMCPEGQSEAKCQYLTSWSWLMFWHVKYIGSMLILGYISNVGEKDPSNRFTARHFTLQYWYW